MLATRSLPFVVVLLAAGAAGAAPSWFKGDLHAHANWGAAQLPTTAPDTVVRWYREHGYHFVAVTDLNFSTPAEGLKALYDAPSRFLVIPGIELSQEGLAGDKIVDTVGIGIRGKVVPVVGADAAAVLDAQAKAIRKAGGLPIAAHPNLTYAVSAADLIASDQTPAPRFFEVWNTEPGMNNLAGGGKPSTERIWDDVLSSGRLLYGVAADDAHHFDEGTLRVADRPRSLPGLAWIMVRAPELSQRALIEAMVRGDFYATTGVLLETYEVTAAEIRIDLSDRTRDLGWSAPNANPQLYRTEFIGKEGRVLAVDESLHPRYRFAGTEQYVRARITSSDGLFAWTQPVLVAKP